MQDLPKSLPEAQARVDKLQERVDILNDAMIQANGRDWRGFAETLPEAQRIRDAEEAKLVEAKRLLEDMAALKWAARPKGWPHYVEPETKGYLVAGDASKTVFKTEAGAIARAEEILFEQPDRKSVGIVRLEAHLVVAR